MIRLKKLLSDSSKSRRNRRNFLNIQITILGWLIEVLGFLIVLVGTAIVGHGNGTVTMAFQTSSMLFYAVLLPCSMLVNSSEVKDYILESWWYIKFFQAFGCRPVYPSTSDNDDAENAEKIAVEQEINAEIQESNGENVPNNAEPMTEPEDNDDIDPDFLFKKRHTHKKSTQNIEVVDLENYNDTA